MDKTCNCCAAMTLKVFLENVKKGKQDLLLSLPLKNVTYESNVCTKFYSNNMYIGSLTLNIFGHAVAVF